MPLRTRLVTLAALCLPITALAANPELKLPKFDHLQKSATEAVNITIGRGLLSLASFAMKHDKDKDNAAALELISGLRAIHVRSYEFAEDNMYSKADIDKVRAQLSEPGWTPLAQIKQRRGHPDVELEDVDVYVSVQGDQINGLAVVATCPRKFVIVNLVGTIDIERVAELEGRFGIPEHAM
jgi:hypothetical protein